MKRKTVVDNHGKCDNPGCTNFNDGSYGSGRFCSKRCACQYAYYGKRRKGKKTEKQLAHLEKIHKLRKVHVGGWKCKVCGEVFDTRAKLNHHCHEAHNLKVAIKLENGLFECPYCHSTWLSRRHLGGHLTNCKLHPNKALHDEGHKKAGKKYAERYANYKIVPSFLGKHHSSKTKEKISQATTKQTFNGGHERGMFKNIKYYKAVSCDGQEYLVQGRWELNVANHLCELGIPWQNTTRIKYFNGFIRSYRPDMSLLDGTYIEVKGIFFDKDREKMKCVLRSNPGIKIYFIHAQDYHDFIAGKIDLEERLLLTLDNIDLWSRC